MTLMSMRDSQKSLERKGDEFSVFIYLIDPHLSSVQWPRIVFYFLVLDGSNELHTLN